MSPTEVKLSADARSLFEISPGMNILFLPNAPHFTIAAVSKKLLQFLNRNNNELVGKTPFEAFPANPADPSFSGHNYLRKSLEYVIANKNSTETNLQRYDVDLGGGKLQELYWQTQSMPVFDDKGEVAYIFHSATDITDKILLEKKEHSTRRNFENILNHTLAPYAILKGEEMIFTYVNKSFQVLMGNRPLIGKTVLEAMPEVAGQSFIAKLGEIFTTGNPFNADEMPFTARFENDSDISTKHFNINFTPYKGDDGIVEGILASGYDVTERVEYKKRLRETDLNNKAHLLLMQAPMAFSYLEGPSYIIKMVNPQALELWGKGNEIIGKSAFDIFPELVGQGFEKILEDVFVNGNPFIASEQPVHWIRNGKPELLYLNFSYHPVRNINGTIEGIISTGFDVTELVEAKLKLAESEARFRNIIEQAPDPILILKGEKMALEIANKPLFDLWNIDERAIGKGFLEILPEMEGQGFMDMLLDVYHNNKTLYGSETPAVFDRGDTKETVYFDFLYHPYKDLDGTILGVLIISTNVTERVMAKLEQQKSETSFRLLANSMPQFVWTADVNGKLTYFNQAVYDFSGLTFEQIETDGWIEIVHPDDKESNIDTWMHSIQTGEDFIFQHRFKKHNGEYRWQLSRAIAQRDAAGNIILWVGTSTDIHDHKLFEEELHQRVAERTMELKKKNEELEQFAHVSSHDLQEPLRKIMMFTDMIKERDYENLSDFSRDKFTKIVDAAWRMSKSLKDILNFSSLTRDEMFEEVDLNVVMNDVQRDLELVIAQKEARLVFTNMPVAKAIALQMHQLFYNLINNALKFAKANELPVIHISCTQLEDDKRKDFLLLDAEKNYYHFTVKDNGIGFDQSYAEKIFTMFQRLHNRQSYSGTGIGLAICKKVVLNHEGCIYAESTPNVGSTFHVLLPIT